MQLDFKFDKKNNYHLDDFIVFEGNQEAFDFVSGKLDGFGESRVFLISGGEKSGKTYLCHIWRKKFGAVFLDFDKINKIKDLKEFYVALMNFIEEGGNYILEDLDKIDLEEEKLFHLINIVNEKGARLLITSEKSVSDFFFEINDLQSRFNSVINFKIGELDEEAKMLYIMKLFADRQMKVEGKIVSVISNQKSVIRKGSYKEVYDFVERVVREFVQGGRRKKITVGFVRKLKIEN